MDFIIDEDKAGSRIRNINMTPLIDVSLVVVVMLLLITPLAFESSIGLGQSQENEPGVEEGYAQLFLYIASEDSVSVNGAMVARASLGRVIEPIISKQGETRVVVRCADTVSHGAFVNVIDQAGICGASGIAVAGR